MQGGRSELVANDAVAQRLGVSVVEGQDGWAVELTVGPDHLNFLDVCHGSVVFALADIALSLASNAERSVALAVNTSISFMKSAKTSDILRATVKPERESRSLGWYRIEVTNQDHDLVATFSGTVYRPSSH